VKDYQAQLEKFRRALIRDLAIGGTKRELFDRLAAHLNVLADQIERAMLARGNAVRPSM
jgi:hypothetical protein